MEAMNHFDGGKRAPFCYFSFIVDNNLGTSLLENHETSPPNSMR
jgi:hypothetical protein